ncbi:hypothetical protein [Pseudogemmobacter sp. W21_MBD1_M6]|uniref:hypothetical protein n=1 Tax=Pseudogemmobacter sp. W21_MBD1_M6 TaxID=3240271 RepID=UPI003F9A5776
MTGKATHKWAFKPGMRAGAYSWKSSAKAIERLKSASAEIRAVARTDPVTAAEGVIVLAQRIWPAFEHIDTSSGALGNAVGRTLEGLLPILIDAPADEKTRAKWLEQLREAIMDDGVDYLVPITERFGQIAAFPALMNLHADRDLDMIMDAWSDHDSYSHVTTGPLGFNLSKTGVSASVKNKAGTFNFLKPQYSSFKFAGLQLRGKKAAQLQLAYMMIMAAVLVMIFCARLLLFALWLLTLPIIFGWDFVVGFIRGVRGAI